MVGESSERESEMVQARVESMLEEPRGYTAQRT